MAISGGGSSAGSELEGSVAPGLNRSFLFRRAGDAPRYAPDDHASPFRQAPADRRRERRMVSLDGARRADHGRASSRTAVVVMAVRRGERLAPLTRTTSQAYAARGRTAALETIQARLRHPGTSGRIYLSSNTCSEVIEAHLATAAPSRPTSAYLREGQAASDCGGPVAPARSARTFPSW